MIQFEEFTGGVFDTNAFLLDAPGGGILIDAPDGADRRFSDQSVKALILTHGHYDHVADAAAVHRRHQCEVGCHKDTVPMIADRAFFKKLGFGFEVEPVPVTIDLREAPSFTLLGIDFQILEVPGHCPGSLCFYLRDEGVLFGGDVLFRDGVGRWDLPGGDRDLLLQGIRAKLGRLPPDTRVFPGHGPPTTLGREFDVNPFLNS